MSQLDPLLSVQDLAVYLDVPVATIYAWRYHRQGPPGLKVGRHVRYRQGDVDRWINDRVLDEASLRERTHR
ncbi:MAG: helix-turn-helix domain-containing protein [Acidobacteria bacterium]|nr:helix-turn-helix domain-containing protein [Acidobacteriota bacterium]